MPTSPSAEYWEWTRIGAKLGAAWHDTEFHVRRAAVDYLKPLVLGDTIEAFVRLERIGTSSLTKRFALANQRGELCAEIEMVTVNVHLPTGRPIAIAERGAGVSGGAGCGAAGAGGLRTLNGALWRDTVTPAKAGVLCG